MKTLYLLVGNFSSNKSEEFFEEELPFLKSRFEKIVVIPLYPGNVKLNKNQEYAEVQQFDAFSSVNRLTLFFKHFILVFRIFIFEFIRTHNKWFYVKNFRTLLNELLYRIHAANKLIDYTKEVQNFYFYSYWFNQWAAIIAILKMYRNSAKVITRAHGSDYKEEQTGRTLAFRYFQISKMDKIVCVSDYAKNYLINKFSTNNKKLIVNRLGFRLHEDLSPVNASKLILVSCSSLIPLKRVGKIVEIISKMDLPLVWHHFGDGPLMNEIKQEVAALSENIQVNLHGHTPNHLFIDFLKKNPITYFINVSEYEGIPVSIMEAISFGIPIIGTNVGGVSEIVNKTTGILVDVNFDPSDVANMIIQNHNSGKIYSETYRKEIKLFSSHNFTIDKNYAQLSNELISIK